MVRIGTLTLKNNLFLAPMAGITDLACRTVARGCGASLCYTEMISADGLARKTRYSEEYLASTVHDSPLGVQLFGSKPAVMAEAARLADERGADLIDVNMGCPVKKVVRTGAGAALMRDPRQVDAIIREMRSATALPLTVKVRSGWSAGSINAVEIARIAEARGADAIAVHSRTALQGYRGTADWRVIEEVKEAVRIPVIGSGDLWSAADVMDMMNITGCDAVMIARGSLGNPWIFEQLCSMLRRGFAPPTPTEREEMIRRHLEMSVMLQGMKAGMPAFRKHLLWYTKGLPGGALFRKSVVEEENMDTVLERLHRFLHDREHLSF